MNIPENARQHHYNGPLTSQHALQVKEDLLNLAKESSTIVLVVDLTEVTEADVVGVNALAIAHKILSEKNGYLLARCKKNGEVARMLHLTKFDQIISVQTTA